MFVHTQAGLLMRRKDGGSVFHATSPFRSMYMRPCLSRPRAGARRSLHRVRRSAGRRRSRNLHWFSLSQPLLLGLMRLFRVPEEVAISRTHDQRLPCWLPCIEKRRSGRSLFLRSTFGRTTGPLRFALQGARSDYPSRRSTIEPAPTPGAAFVHPAVKGHATMAPEL